VIAAVTQLPFLVCTCVLGGFALWGWRRSASTGALLIAIGCGVRALGEVGYIWQLSRLYTSGPASYGRTAILFGPFTAVGGVIADFLFIVGLALILRRLPAAKR
jgi:hypothetical protein